MSSFKKESFLTFLKSINLKKDIKNEEALFNFKKDSIETIVISSEKTVAIKGLFKSSFAEHGKVGIVNLSSIISFIESLSNLKLSFIKNKLSISSNNTKINVTLQNSEYILNSVEESTFNNLLEKTKNGYSLTLSKDDINFLLANYNIISGQELILKSDNKKLLFLCNNKNNETSLETEFENVKTKEDFLLRLPKFFLSILEHVSKIEDSVTINFAKTNPVSVSINTDNSDFSFIYIIALVAEKTSENV